jgi:hypothetical protein
MLKQHNELLCVIGPETAMGKGMRHFWLPALMSSELPHPNGDPAGWLAAAWVNPTSSSPPSSRQSSHAIKPLKRRELACTQQRNGARYSATMTYSAHPAG